MLLVWLANLKVRGRGDLSCFIAAGSGGTAGGGAFHSSNLEEWGARRGAEYRAVGLLEDARRVEEEGAAAETAQRGWESRVLSGYEKEEAYDCLQQALMMDCDRFANIRNKLPLSPWTFRTSILMRPSQLIKKRNPRSSPWVSSLDAITPGVTTLTTPPTSVTWASKPRLRG